MQKKRAGLAALGEWRHINCLRLSAMDDIQDDVLRKLAQLPNAKGDALHHTKSRLDQLLSAVDLGSIEARDDVLTVHDVPGGSISFLFQKAHQC
jgi:DNA repair and recombination protein RAD54B